MGLTLWAAIIIAMVSFHGNEAARTAEEWRDRVIYQILTDRFAPEDSTQTESCDELRSFCGGSFKGVVEKLDYIKGLGANAIWISPIVEQTTGGYHGYWARDLYAIEPRWGTEQDLLDLVTAAHGKEIWIMVDVVPNHMGYPEDCSDIMPCDANRSVDFSELHPFNESQYYHELCQIDWSGDGPTQEEMELCRLANLPDLNQTVPVVRETLLEWIGNLTDIYNIDGYRVDTVRHIEKNFWGEYREAAATFCMGEVWHEEDSEYPAAYQEYLDSITNYPMYRGIKEAFHDQGPFSDFVTNLQDQRDHFQDTSVLTLFIDNHDVARFLNITQDVALFRNALTYISYGEGIPIIYYGTEQDFHGGHDPENRESLWPHYNTESDTYKFLSDILTNRQRLQVGGSPQVEHYVVDDVLVFSRANDMVLVVISNVGSDQNTTADVPDLPQNPEEGMTYAYTNVQDSEDVVTFSEDGTLTVSVVNGLPKIYERISVEAAKDGASRLGAGLLSSLAVSLVISMRYL